jgi:hypothetical protein
VIFVGIYRFKILIFAKKYLKMGRRRSSRSSSSSRSSYSSSSYESKAINRLISGRKRRKRDKRKKDKRDRRKDRKDRKRRDRSRSRDRDSRDKHSKSKKQSKQVNLAPIFQNFDNFSIFLNITIRLKSHFSDIRFSNLTQELFPFDRPASIDQLEQEVNISFQIPPIFRSFLEKLFFAISNFLVQ